MAPRSVFIAFDLYGTLLSTTSISTSLATTLDLPPSMAQTLALRWRDLQLSYSFRLSSMTGNRPDPPTYPPATFRHITKASLLHVLAESQIPTPTPEVLAQLMSAYDALPPFPDAMSGLERLRTWRESQKGSNPATVVKATVFSNGSEKSVTDALINSGLVQKDAVPNTKEIGPATLSPTGSLDGVISVQPTGQFKPSRTVYEHMFREMTGHHGDPDNWDGGEIWLVSSNPFDVVGFLGSGIPNVRAVWVDRAGKGWVDRLGTLVGVEAPMIVVRSVDEAVEMILDIWVA